MKLDKDCLAVGLERDAEGNLFDLRLRETLARSGNGANPRFEAVASLRIAARRIHILRERWADKQGLSEGRLELLLKLHWAPPEGVSLGELAEAMRVSPRNITGLVDNLERDGLVERVPDKRDRRSIRARLTEAGGERIGSLWKPALGQQSTLFEGFTPDDLVRLRHLCLRLVE